MMSVFQSVFLIIDRLTALVILCYQKNVDLVISTNLCYHRMLSQCQMSPCGVPVHRTGANLQLQEVRSFVRIIVKLADGLTNQLQD